METEYRRDFSHSYLVIHQKDSHSYQTYSWKMLTENEIPGLISCECRRIDDEVLFYYDITSKISLKEKSLGKKLRGEEICFLLQGILKVLAHMEEYLLPEESLCLRTEYIYVDAEMEQIEFCYVPGETWNLEKSIRGLLEELLLVLDHTDQRSAAQVYKLYEYIVNEKFSPESMEQQLQIWARENKKEELPPRDGNDHKELKGQEVPENQKEEFPEEVFEKKEEMGKEPSFPRTAMPVLTVMVLINLLTGWYMWRNYPDYVWCWIGGTVLLLALSMFLCVLWGKKKKRMDHGRQEVEEPVQQEKEFYGAEEWMGETETEEQENFTTVLDRDRAAFWYFERAGTYGEYLKVLDQEIQFLGHLEGKVDLMLPSQAVSRIHARLRKSGQEYYLSDMNSKNGTWVNQQELVGGQEVLLKEGDEIRFGDLSYHFIRL